MSGNHFKQLIYIPDELKRDFYSEMCRVEGWSTRVLARKVVGMFYERTALNMPVRRFAARTRAAHGPLMRRMVQQGHAIVHF